LSIKVVSAAAVVLLVAVTSVKLVGRMGEDAGRKGNNHFTPPAPVEVALIRQGAIELTRTFSGALESTAKFNAAPKIGGRVASLEVDIGDTISRGQLIARLDDEEYVQSVAQARADVAVAQATLAEAKSVLLISLRETKRVELLLEQKIAHEAQHDEAKAKELEKRAQMEVARAKLSSALAGLEAANIRLGYTTITASWTGGAEQRVVAERYIDEGYIVSANTPLVQIVELNPITGVFYVSEKDYSRLAPGQKAVLTTEAYPGETFQGVIERIAPIFRQTTRQARVELNIDNSSNRLKPGMFIQVIVSLGEADGATLVPEEALTTRGGHDGLFLVREDGKTVAWRETNVGIREGGLAQVTGEGLSGRVVTLGQHLLNDGSTISIPDGGEKPAPAPKAKDNP